MTRADDADFGDEDGATAQASADKRRQRASYDDDEDGAEEENDAADVADDEAAGADAAVEDANANAAGPSDGAVGVAAEGEAPALVEGAASGTAPRRRPLAVSDPHLAALEVARDGSWCEICLAYPLDDRKLLMVSLVEAAAATAVLREVSGLARCFIEENEKPEDERILLATEGVNLRGMWEFADEVDVRHLHSNDVRAILNTYGVEAARLTIVREIGRVFSVYGISVDTRHLSLVADAMVSACTFPRVIARGPQD